MSKVYKSAGVNLKKNEKLIKNIKNLTSKKNNEEKNCLSSIGGFSSLFELPSTYKKPVLVSACDGVGTKLLLSFKSNNYSTIGIDLVAMNVNDLITCGAKPLYFLDYLAVQKINIEVITKIIKSIIKGCELSDCKLVGGETAEMKPLYLIEKSFDIAGFVTGVVEKSKIINGSNIKENDVIIGLNSNGIHSNGFSLVNKVFFEDNSYSFDHNFKELDCPLIDELLKPTKIYVKEILELLENFKINGMVHITGGGFQENIPRILNESLCAEIYISKINIKPIFNIIKRIGNISKEEMFKIFNMGIGYVLIVDKSIANEVCKFLNKISNIHNYANIIGKVLKKKINKDKLTLK